MESGYFHQSDAVRPMVLKEAAPVEQASSQVLTSWHREGSITLGLVQAFFETTAASAATINNWDTLMYLALLYYYISVLFS